MVDSFFITDFITSFAAAIVTIEPNNKIPNNKSKRYNTVVNIAVSESIRLLSCNPYDHHKFVGEIAIWLTTFLKVEFLP